MPIQVQLPDGSIGEFPDNMSEQQIQSTLQKQFPPTNPSPELRNQQQTSGMASSFMAGVDGFNRQFEKLAIGGLQIGAAAIDKLAGTNTQQSINQLNKQGYGGLVVGEEQANKQWNEHPYAYGTGAAAGILGQGVASGVQGIAGSAVTGGVFGALQPSDTMRERLFNATLGAGLGAVGGAIAEVPGLISSSRNALSKQSGSVAGTVSRILNPEESAIKDAAYMVDSAINAGQAGQGITTGVTGALDDFNKLGMKATIGQATGSPELQAVEKAIVQGPVGNREVLNFQKPQLETLRNKLTDTIKAMAPEDAKAFVAETRPQLAQTNVSDDAVQSLLSDSQLTKMLGGLPDNIDIAQLPNSSVAKWDYIKHNIDDTLFNDKHALSDKLGTDVKDSLIAARSKIVQTLDNEVGEIYQPYRQAAQKVAIQNNYTKLLDSIPGPQGEASTFTAKDGLENLSQTVRTLWGDTSKKTAFLDDVATVGGDVDTAKAIINVSNILAKTSIDKAAGKSPNTLTRLFSADKNMVANFLDNMVNGGYKQALIDLTMSGQEKWAPLIQKEIIKQSTPEGKVKGFMKLIGRAAGAATESRVGRGATSALGGQVGGIFTNSGE